MPLKITFDIAQNSVRWTDADVRAIKKGVRAALNFSPSPPAFCRTNSSGRAGPSPARGEGVVRRKREKFPLPLREGIKGRGIAVSITLGTNRQIQKLNAQWRGKNKPTNVLSFPTDALENITDYPAQIPLPLGDIILAHETSTREAKNYGIKFQHYIMFLAVHGTLHLLGYDHETDAQHRQMMRAEIKILTQLGLANPYPFMHNNDTNA